MLESAHEIRKLISERRKLLTADQHRELSTKIIRRFLSFIDPQIWSGLKVGLYSSLPEELFLEELAVSLRDYGAHLHYPRILSPEQKTLEFVRVEEKTLWQKGPYGIKEPIGSLTPCRPEELQVLFVPGLAFGLQGERLGWGAGYYDRFTARLQRLLKVVLAFDFQLLGQLPQSPWDQPVDWIVTEAREVRNSRAQTALESRFRLMG